MNEHACIIVSTPFQMISAFSILEQYSNYIFDLYLIDNFGSCKSVAENTRREAVFDNVTVCSLDQMRPFHVSSPSNFKERVFRSIGRQVSYLRYKKTMKKIIVRNDYKIVFFAAANSSMELLMYLKKTSDPNFVMFDDGVMSYRNPNYTSGDIERFKLIRKMILGGNGNIQSSKLLYMPELFSKLNNSNEEIIKLHKSSPETMEVEKRVFGVSPKDIIGEKIIILECLSSEYLDSDEDKHLESIYCSIEGIHKSDDIIYKKHPRDSKGKLPYRKYMDGKVPFECYNFIQNFNNKVLIAWDSTAVLTSKLFFDQEPHVVLLYKLVKGRMKNEAETDSFYQKFKECYRDPERFIVPSTEEQLLSCLERLSND